MLYTTFSGLIRAVYGNLDDEANVAFLRRVDRHDIDSQINKPSDLRPVLRTIVRGSDENADMALIKSSR